MLLGLSFIVIFARATRETTHSEGCNHLQNNFSHPSILLYSVGCST